MLEEKKFVSLDAIPAFLNDARIEFYSVNGKWSLLDFDSVIVCPDFFLNVYKQEGICEDVPKLDREDSRRIEKNFDSIRSQLIELLQQGKNIYVFVGLTNKCYRYTGELGCFGLPNVTELFDLYSFLPVNVSLVPMRGYNIELVDSKYKDFFLSINKYVEYNSVINVTNGCPFLRIKGTKKVVGTIVPYLNGKIVFLPYFNCFSSNAVKNDEMWQKVFDAIYSLDELLTKKEVVEYPEWIDDYNILTESEDIAQLQNLENEKEKLQKRIDSQKCRLEILKKYKGLFTSTGHQLENIVKDVLTKLGFEILPSDSRRSDVIATYQNQDIVAEVKGVKKSATEEYARQLEAWNSDFWRETKRVAKCILIVNGFMDKKLEERNEPVFPDPMLKYCIGHEQCLISTTQLLCLFIEITENPECKDERINELLTTVGVYNRYPDYTKFIKKVK